MIKIDGHIFINESKNLTHINSGITSIFTGNSICINCGYVVPHTIDNLNCIYITLNENYLTCKNYIIKTLLE